MDNPRQVRAVSAMASAGVVAAIGYALIFGLAARVPAFVSDSITLVSLARREPEPTPKPPPKPRAVDPAKPKAKTTGSKAKGAPSPENLRNRATQVVAPKLEPLIVPPPIVAATQAGIGSAANTGASDRIGPGQGAGGIGNGFGGGGDGDGGGDGGGDVPPRQIGGRLSFSDLPADLRQVWRGGAVSVRYAVNTDGRAGNCLVTGSSGSAELDRITCALIEQRFRFKPSLDEHRRPVRSIIVETHGWTIDRSDEEPARARR